MKSLSPGDRDTRGGVPFFWQKGRVPATPASTLYTLIKCGFYYATPWEITTPEEACHHQPEHTRVLTYARRCQASFCIFLFLQAHRETTAHFTAIGMPAQQHFDSFRCRRAVFYNGLKSKVGLAAGKTAAMQLNLNIDGCGVIASPVHSSSRTPLLLAAWQPLCSQPPPPPRRSTVRERWPDLNAQAAACGVL